MPDDIRLVLPFLDGRASFLDAAAELRATYGDDTHWGGNQVLGTSFTDEVLATDAGFAEFLDLLARMADPSYPLPDGWVHASTLWLVDFATEQPTYLGRLSFRHELNEFLATVGGHIGYVIRPSAQRRGLGTRMLAMALPITAAFGLEKVLITCDDDNAASAKVIVANGGVEDEAYRNKRRFWVPTRPRLAAIEPDLPGVLRRQLALVQDWVGTFTAADLATPSPLDGWTVADLVGHLARSGSTFSLATVAPGEAPLTIDRYVSGYAAAAEEIADGTRAFTVASADDLTGAVERVWTAGLTALDAFGVIDQSGPVIRGPRGPILLSDFVATRILELVVHTDDLARSLSRPAPQDPSAVSVVTALLTQIWADRYPSRPIPSVTDELDWIRQACGRISPLAPVEGLPLL